MPSRAFNIANIQKYINENPQLTTIIVHCMMSQVRGPKFARIISEAVLGDNIETYILEGGFTQWMQLYGADKTRVDELTKEWRYMDREWVYQ